ncbi:MAG: helix-turn-helix transcriptional regulator [bacterium]|nr:helix-turn-helix transcriptional regulator [bacterium]
MTNDEFKTGKRLKAIREHLGLRQNEFAAKLNVSTTALSDLEHGRYAPNFKLIATISQEFNVNLYYLFFGQGEMFGGMDFETKSRAITEDFGTDKGHVLELLDSMRRSPFLYFMMMAHFRLTLSVDQQTIQKEFKEFEEKQEGEKNENNENEDDTGEEK